MSKGTAARSTTSARPTIAFVAVAALMLAPLTILSVAPTAAEAADANAAPSVGEFWEFEYTGAPETLTVPEDVDVVTIIAAGGEGEQGERYPPNPRSGAGRGGIVMSTFPVDPGSDLTVWVGGSPDSGGWGFGCGGEGGTGEGHDGDGGDGGGASAVTTGTAPPSARTCDENARPGDAAILLVGGGGGGGGGVFNEGSLTTLGVGGMGGLPPGAGTYGTDDANCGGCQSGRNGEHGFDSYVSGAPGGGGGGFHGGAGSNDPASNGAGGGGGSSYISNDSGTYFNGAQSGDGSVTIFAGYADQFGCTGEEQALTVPADVGIMRVYAVGGHGGTREDDNGAPGGFAGFVSADYDVEPGDAVGVGVGCYGASAGGWGGSGMHGGDQGHADSAIAHDGAGGGGASVVTHDGEIIAVAGGGGGGGGNSDAEGQRGGGGGTGGMQPGDGSDGQDETSKAADGGCGGCEHHSNGSAGYGSSVWAQGGGGGGGGGGYYGGGGGLGGNAVGGGGGGGGGGASFASNVRPGTVTHGTIDLLTDGIVLVIMIPGGAATITTYGGNDQSAPFGNAFAEPLRARVTDLSGHPVAGTTVTFDVSGSGGVGATFPDAGTRAVAVTDANGVAVSPPFTAGGGLGTWLGLATAELIHGGEPAEFTLSNEPAATATTATLDPATPAIGQPFAFDAQVTLLPSGAPAPSGKFEFTIDDGETIQTDVTDGRASGSYTPDPANPSTWLPVGSHTLHATYFGDADANASGADIPFTVTAIPVTITVASSLNPADPGQPVSFTATVRVPDGAPMPVGADIHFTTPMQSLGTATLGADGTATVGPITDLLPGGYPVQAQYAGDATHSAGVGLVVQHIGADGTAVAMRSNPSPSEYGATVTYSATVTPAASIPRTPEGTVTFSTGGVDLCVGDLDATAAASCTSDAALEPGDHVIEARYHSILPDFSDSTGMAIHTVSPMTTTTAVSVAPQTSVPGEGVTLTATVDWGGHPPADTAGEIQFFVDGIATGAAIPVGGSAVSSPPIDDLAVGAHTVSAQYSGTAEYAASIGHTTQRVDAASTATALVASSNPSDPGEGVSFTATVSRVAPAMGVPTGAVQFRADGVAFGPPVLLDGGGIATSRPIDSLTPGTHDITATFVPIGDADAPSTGRMDQAVRTTSTTALRSSNNPATIGEPVIATASVWPSSATGSVSFAVDGNVACADVPLEPDANAVCALDGLAVGDVTVTATYSGSAQYTSSNASLTETVERIATRTRLVSSADPSVSGQPVDFSTTVTHADLGTAVTTGAVQFRIDGNAAGAPVTLDAAGTAELSDVVTLEVGDHEITAEYVGTDDLAPSADTARQHVDPATTATLVISSMNPSETGDPVTFTAHVGVRAPAAGVPTGTVQFSVDEVTIGGPVPVAADGTATSASLADLGVTTHDVVAVYSGDSAFSGSTGRLIQAVGAGATATHVTSSVSPSVFGEVVTFTARVGISDSAIGTPTGTVQFAVDGDVVGAPVALGSDGTAESAAIGDLDPGEHTITAQYSGDADFTASTGSTVHVVDRTATSTAVDPSTSAFGEPTTFTARITTRAPGAGLPIGTVQFTVDGEPLGDPVVVTDGAAASPVVDSLLPGVHDVAARFIPGSDFRGSSGEAVATVVAAASHTVVSSSADPAGYGEPLTFTATVSAGPTGSHVPSGSVDFSIDGVMAAERVVLHDGVATLAMVDDLGAGDHTITVTYRGNDEFLPSSGELTQTITPAATAIELESNLNPSAYGQDVWFTATLHQDVTIAAVSAVVPTGTVQFVVDGEPLGDQVPVDDGVAQSPHLSTLDVGDHTIEAVFTGDIDFVASTGTLVHRVVVLASSTTLDSSRNPSPAGERVTFTAVVQSAAGSALPTGSVQFSVDGRHFGGSVQLVDGRATVRSNALLAGEHEITARYSGDEHHGASAASVMQSVTARALPATGVDVVPLLTLGGLAFVLGAVALGRARRFTARR